MNKIIKPFFYLLKHPQRAINIFSLYRGLHGKYKYTIILAHAYREAIYIKKKNEEVKITIENQQKTCRQTIISIHDGLLRSGGLTDRLKGICTLYAYAKKNNYDFKIYFVAPFVLQKYLVPNTYHWDIDNTSILYDLDSVALYTWETESLAYPFFEKNQNKLQLHVGCNSGECASEYSLLFHELFKPSKLLSDALGFHLEKLGGCKSYISISFRFQNLLGEFKEGNSIALKIEDRDVLIKKCLAAIKRLKEEHADVDTILITSDSNLFREIAASNYDFIYTYVVPEEVGHLDYAAAGKGKELTAFLDLFLIAEAKKAYQIRSNKMYNSDFPNMAAKMNDTPYEVILLN